MVVPVLQRLRPGRLADADLDRRKLQALQALLFPELGFQVRRVALRQIGCSSTAPSSPLAEGHRSAPTDGGDGGRADRDRRAGVARAGPTTEIARQAGHPSVLRRLPNRRVGAARAAWLEEAGRRLHEQLGEEEVERIRTEAAERLEEMRAEVARLNEAMSIDVGDRAAEIEIPEPVLDAELMALPLIDSDWDWVDQTPPEGTGGVPMMMEGTPWRVGPGIGSRSSLNGQLRGVGRCMSGRSGSGSASRSSPPRSPRPSTAATCPAFGMTAGVAALSATGGRGRREQRDPADRRDAHEEPDGGTWSR